jgi:hypothetical protein
MRSASHNPGRFPVHHRRPGRYRRRGAGADAWHRSSFTARAYQDVLATGAYQAGLHVLREAPDGTMASTAMLWFDELNHGAEFDPAGTLPHDRRRALGRALLLHGMHVVAMPWQGR